MGTRVNPDGSVSYTDDVNGTGPEWFNSKTGAVGPPPAGANNAKGGMGSAGGPIDPNSPQANGAGGSFLGNPQAGLTYGQYWNIFQDPYRQQNAGAIQGMQGQMLQGYGPGGSNLAGLTTLGPMQNAQAATIDTGQSQNLMGGQVQNINALNAQAQGMGPSVAEQVAKQQAEQNTKAQMAAIGSQRGASNSALGLRAAQDNAAQNQQQAAQSAALGRSQEAMGARQQLGGALSGATQQAQQGAQAQAQLSQQAGLQNAATANQAIQQQAQMNQQTKLANLSAMLQAGQINMNQYNAMTQATLAQNNNDWSGGMNAANQLMGENTQLIGIQNQQAINNANNMMGLVGAGISGGAGLVAGGLSAFGGEKTSDERLKTSVRSAERSLKDFMSQIGDGMGQRFALMGA